MSSSREITTPPRRNSTMRPSDLRHFITCAVIWSTTWIAITFQLGDVAPAVSVFWRFGLAALLLAVHRIARGYPLRPTLAAQREMFAMGAFCFAALTSVSITPSNTWCRGWWRSATRPARW